MVNTVASQQEGFWVSWGLSVWSLACSVLRLIGDSRLALGVSVSGCLSLYVGPVIDW